MEDPEDIVPAIPLVSRPHYTTIHTCIHVRILSRTSVYTSLQSKDDDDYFSAVRAYGYGCSGGATH